MSPSIGNYKSAFLQCFGSGVLRPDRTFFFLGPDRDTIRIKKLWIWIHQNRAVDPRSFFADPDPVVLLNADPAISLKNADTDPA